jgi:hypothetical protein
MYMKNYFSYDIMVEKITELILVLEYSCNCTSKLHEIICDFLDLSVSLKDWHIASTKSMSGIEIKSLF